MASVELRAIQTLFLHAQAHEDALRKLYEDIQELDRQQMGLNSLVEATIPVGALTRWQQVLVVAKTGGDFESIQDAIDDITDAATGKRYLVLVMPGEYNETVTMKEYVDVVGVSKHACRITGAGGVVGADNCLLQNLTLTAGPLTNANGNNGFIAKDVDGLGNGNVLTSGRYERVNIKAASGADLLNIGTNSEANVPIFDHCTFELTSSNSSFVCVELTAVGSWAEFHHCTIRATAGLAEMTLFKTAALTNRRQLMMHHCSLIMEHNHNDALNNDKCLVFQGGGEFWHCTFFGYKLLQAELPEVFGSFPACGVLMYNCSSKGGARVSPVNGASEFYGCNFQSPIKVQLKASATFSNCATVNIDSFNASGSATLNIYHSQVQGAWTYTAGTWTVRLDGNSYIGDDINILTQNANITYTGTDIQTHLFPPSELTIASGAITVVRNFHTVDTQSDASTDDLDTINGGTAGEVITLRADNTARTVVLKHNTGNIQAPHEDDTPLDTTEKGVRLFYDGANWIIISGDTSTPAQILKRLGAQHPLANTYVSATGTAGSDNTAQDVKTVVIPAGTLTQVNDRIRIRVYWKGDTGAAITSTVKVNGVTIATSVDVGGVNLFTDQAWLHYIDASTANIIESGSHPATGANSAVNVAGFDWASDQNVVVSQDAVVNNHIIVFAIFLDVMPKGVV